MKVLKYKNAAKNIISNLKIIWSAKTLDPYFEKFQLDLIIAISLGDFNELDNVISNWGFHIESMERKLKIPKHDKTKHKI